MDYLKVGIIILDYSIILQFNLSEKPALLSNHLS